MSMTVIVKIKREDGVETPFYATPGAAGMDVKANIAEPITLKPLERVLIPTGLKVELPHGVEMQVRPRSGMCIKHGITVLNAPGTVDEDYRGEVGVILVNLSNEEYTIQPKERVAQLVFADVINVKLIDAEVLSETERGEGGFGHTGK